MKKIMIALFCLFAVAGTTKATTTYSENSITTEKYSDQMIKEVQELGRLAAEEGYKKINKISCRFDMELFGYFQDAYDKRRAELDPPTGELIARSQRVRYEHVGILFINRYGL